MRKQEDNSIPIENDTMKLDKEEEKNTIHQQKLLNWEAEYQRILIEQEKKDRGGISDSSTPQIEAKRIKDENQKIKLKMLREQRDKLLGKLKRIQEEIAQATDSYDRSNGNLQEREPHNLDDE